MYFISASMMSSKNVSVLRRGAWKFIMDPAPHSPVCFLLYLCIALNVCDYGKELMSVIFIGCLYKEWFFRYSNKVKCDVATQEVLLTAEYLLPEKNCLLHFYCKCHLNVRHLAILLAALGLSYTDRHYPEVTK